MVHARPAFGWRKPEDFDDLRSRVRVEAPCKYIPASARHMAFSLRDPCSSAGG